MCRFQPGQRAALYLLLSSSFATIAEPVRLTEQQVASEFDCRFFKREHGLPDERVNSVLQTRDGYLWMGTQRGLARFDGLQFTVFNSANTPAFASDDCWQLAEDIEGALWIATGSGLVRKTGNAFTRFTPDERGRAVLEYARLCPSRAGGVIAGRDRTLCWLDGHGFHCHIPQWPVRDAGVLSAMLEDETGALWLATWAGVLRYVPDTKGMEMAPLGKEFENVPATAMLRTPAGYCWVVLSEAVPPPQFINASRWLACFKDGQVLRSPDFARPDFLSGRSEFILQDSQGTIWLGGTADGIHRYFGGQFEQLPVPPKVNQDWAMCATLDREDNLWIGTTRNGLQCWTRKRATWYSTGDSQEDANAWTILQTQDGTVWAGTDGGVCQFEGESARYVTNSPAPIRNVRALAQDSDGVIWAGTMRDLHFLKDGLWTRFMLPGEWVETKIRALVPAKQGGLWIGTVRGLSHLHEGKLRKYTSEQGLATNEVRALLESRAGGLWVGTLGGGLCHFQDNRFTTLTTKDGLSNNNVWALHEDGQGVLWIGTEHGLNRLHNGKLSAFTELHGLPESQVNSIVEDDCSRLWIGHDRGIYWVFKRELEEVAAGTRKSVQAAVHDEPDDPVVIETNGQKSNPAVCRTADGHLWFPTTRGVLEIDPADADLDRTPPLTVIESILANGEVVWSCLPPDYAVNQSAAAEPPKALRLPPGGGRLLQVHFTARCFTAPEKTRFRYRLRGLSERWIDLERRREVHFYDLRPSDYVLEVIACNRHGVWQDQGATLAFQLAPFYYQTWWFYGLAVAVVGSIAALGLTWRMRELRKMHELKRLNALNEQRQRIARDVHDELGAALTHILQLSKGDVPSATTSSAQRIASIAEAAVDNMGGIVWANNPEFDTLDDLSAYAREYTAGFLASSNLEATLEFPESGNNPPISGFVRRHVLLILKEALQNVVKHARASRVRVALELNDHQLTLCVADNGRGLPEKGQRRFGTGLTNMRTRVEELGGALVINSGPGQGTAVRVRVPLHPS